MKTCPYCAEDIKEAAVVCKHCGKDQPPPGHEVISAEWYAAYKRLSARPKDQQRRMLYSMELAQRTELRRISYLIESGKAVIPSVAPAAAPQPQQDNTLAGVASFFVPGLGQLVQGRVGAGILFFILASFCWLFLMGWLWHLIAAVDAAQWKG